MAHLFPSLGPALVISMGYIDLGKWLAAVDGGVRFGNDLVLLVLFFNLTAILFQYLATCVGIVTRKNLAQVLLPNLFASIFSHFPETHFFAKHHLLSCSHRLKSIKSLLLNGSMSEKPKAKSEYFDNLTFIPRGYGKRSNNTIKVNVWPTVCSTYDCIDTKQFFGKCTYDL